MEQIARKYEQMFKRVKVEQMGRWEELQSLLISQFNNAASIIKSLPLLQDPKHLGALSGIDGIQDALLVKQMDSLRKVLQLMNRTLEGFRGIVISLEKMVRDSKQLVGEGGARLSDKQLNQHIGIKPTIAYYLDGLKTLEKMHRDEYDLKLTLVSKLADVAMKIAPKNRASGNLERDLNTLNQVLVDQPNIPHDEVQSIYDIIFAEEIAS